MINTNIKKYNQQTTGLIERLDKNIQFCQLVLLSQRSFVSVNVLVVYKSVLHGKQFLDRQTRGIEQNTSNFRRVYWCGGCSRSVLSNYHVR